MTPAQPQKEIDLEELRDVLCCVSQIFNGWRPAEEWSAWDEQIAQRVVALQRQLEPATTDNAASCPNCGGTGVVADMAKINRTGDPHINRRCRRCKGTGKLAATLQAGVPQRTTEAK